MSELDSFILKFKHLWKTGHDAHLDIEAKAGKAWVGIRLCLADEPGPLHQPVNLPKTISRSRDRRRKRREAEREENIKTESATEKVAAVTDTIEEKSNEIVVTEAAEIDLDSEEMNLAEKAKEDVQTNSKATAAEASDIIEGASSEGNDFVKPEEEKESEDEKIADEKEIVEIEVSSEVNETETDAKPVRPAVETVYSTAVIGETDASSVTNDQLNAVLSIIRGKEHLRRNIASVNIGSVQTYQLRGGKFEHQLQIMIHVNTASLWENSRSYLFHHLGRDTWNLSDGTEICIKRIHQKSV